MALMTSGAIVSPPITATQWSRTSWLAIVASTIADKSGTRALHGLTVGWGGDADPIGRMAIGSSYGQGSLDRFERS